MLTNIRRDLVFAIFVSLTSSFLVAAHAQSSEWSNSPTLESRLKRAYKLTSSDLQRIRPLISRESENVAQMYGRYSAERYRQSFLSLWDGIRANRWEFEAGLPADLTARQKNALRAARTEFESRSVNLWLEDYVEFLADVLDFDRLQMNCSMTIFGIETEKRLRLIVKETEKSVRMTTEWDSITNVREEELKKILDIDQLRAYLSLGLPLEGLVAEVFLPFRGSAMPRQHGEIKVRPAPVSFRAVTRSVIMFLFMT